MPNAPTPTSFLTPTRKLSNATSFARRSFAQNKPKKSQLKTKVAKPPPSKKARFLPAKPSFSQPKRPEPPAPAAKTKKRRINLSGPALSQQIAQSKKPQHAPPRKELPKKKKKKKNGGKAQFNPKLLLKKGKKKVAKKSSDSYGSGDRGDYNFSFG